MGRSIPKLAALAVVALLDGACVGTLAPCGQARPGDVLECPADAGFDRGLSIRVPRSWDGSTPLPVIVAFHGGGGNRRSADGVTCPDGVVGGPACLSTEATARGYVVVYPDGTGTRPFRNVRTWNAGGGRDGWDCTSGGACASGVDDVAFFDGLLAQIERIVPIDAKRVFLTGLSNGGAMAHRLACERPQRVAAIATVGAANQFAAAGGACEAQVPVLHIHGTEDPCWGYATSSASCLAQQAGRKIGVAESVEGWRQRNGCAANFLDEALPDLGADGTRALRRRWQGCKADLELLRIEGGGHTWPGGNPYLPESRVGRVSHDLRGNAEVLRFFDAHPRP